MVESMMYAFMGLGALLLIVAPFVLGVVLWRKGEKNPSGYRLGSIVGLLLSPVLTLAVAGYMSTSGSHWVGETTGDGTGLPLFGWSRQAGDLRVPHFFATHALQILPIVGFLCDRAAWRSKLVVWITAAMITLLVGGLFALAMSGRPLIPL